MNKILSIGRYTFLEVVKSKIMINTAILGLALAIISFLSTGLTYGVPEKVAMDVGLGLLSLSLNGIAIFIGVNLVAKEIEQRTIYTILSRSVTRTSYFIGRILGMVLVLLLDFLILSIIITIITLILGGELTSLYPTALVFILLESIWLLSIVVIFSLITNVTMSVVYSISIYIAGHALTETISLVVNTKDEFSIKLLKTASLILPNFSKLNIKDFLLYKHALEPSYLWGTFFYFLIYLAAIIFASLAIFNAKELD